MKTLDNINLDKQSGNYETVLTPTDQLSAGVKAIIEIFEEQGVPKYKVDNIAKLFGSVIKVAGKEQGAVEFTSDPQQQLDIIESDIATLDTDKATSESVALNTEAIARLDLEKQNALPRKDLDNIAKLNLLGEPNGIASLDEDGKVPTAQLPTSGSSNAPDYANKETITLSQTGGSKYEGTYTPNKNGYIYIKLTATSSGQNVFITQTFEQSFYTYYGGAIITTVVVPVYAINGIVSITLFNSKNVTCEFVPTRG